MNENHEFSIEQRVSALREELARQNLAGLIVPRADEHQGEYVPPSAERLSWISGFTGSAGLCIVMTDKAAVFIDGRYTFQVRDETPASIFEYCHLIQEPATDWIAANLGPDQALGFDPRLTTPNQATRYRRAAERAGGKLVAVETNPLDTVWVDQPEPPLAPVVPHDMAFSGRPSKDKRNAIAVKLVEQGQDAMVIAEPDCTAWLLNVRGGDLEFTPQPLSFSILHADGTVDWFLDPAKEGDGLVDSLDGGIRRHHPDSLAAELKNLGQDAKTVRIDPDSSSEWIRGQLSDSGAKVAYGPDLCLAERAQKSAAEVDGMRSAHLRDGAALVRFLAWLDAEAPSGSISEIDAANHLEQCRRTGNHFKGLSFPTISGSGPNGAIVHYRVTPKTDRKLGTGELYLVDSGAQYLDGTTDVTRTIAIGEPTDEMRRTFTLVLLGHIALATARFPKGTTGPQLDGFARRPLWQAGLDFDHGTGHGVGSYLSVHEGPHRIAKGPNAVALAPGMVVSNEPGYYKTGAFGIRIENLVLATSVEPPAGAERDLLGFETLTLAPIDRRLIATELLDEPSRGWLNAYHSEVRDKLSPLLESVEAQWLEDATRPL